MRETLSAIWSTAAALLGLAVFVILIWWIAKAHSRLWRIAATCYSERRRYLVTARKLETIVIARRGALRPANGLAEFRQYAGTVIAVTPDGLRLTAIPIPPFTSLCSPLFLPFDQMTLDQTSWAIWHEPFAARMTGLPDIDVILSRDAVRWIRAQTDKAPFGWDG